MSTEPPPSAAGGGSEPDDAAPVGPQPEPLTSPRDGLPDVVVDDDGLQAAIALLAGGHGPVAVDAERASGYRYSQRAYLIQLRRAGAGTVLVDPIPLPDLSALGSALQSAEWVLHAASQDLWCLHEVGMVPQRIFDTELAARLLGHPRVGLGPLVEEVLGFALEKGHSAADWSTRPLPEAWLRYAALDVELLVELRDVLAAELDAAGKRDWAEEEFGTVLAATAPPRVRVDPWRRTSGVHRVRDRRRLAAVRELWTARDALARDRDIAPGRVLPDSAVVEAATTMPGTTEELLALPVFRGRAQRREADRWFAAVQRAREASPRELPPSTLSAEGPPPPRSWANRAPEAAARLTAARSAVASTAERIGMPTENLLTPDLLRRLAWSPPTEVTAGAVDTALADMGARSWQRALVVPVVVAAFETARPATEDSVTGE